MGGYSQGYGGFGGFLQPGTQTTTVQKIMDQCSLHTKLQNFFSIGGITNEPGMMIANNVNQQLLARPFAWKFNRWALPFFVTQFGIQDYNFAGACAFAISGNAPQSGVWGGGGWGGTGNSNTAGFPNGGVGIDLATNNAITVSGTTATIKTLDPVPFQIGQTIFMSGNNVAGWNSTFLTNAPNQMSAWVNGWVVTAIPTPYSFQIFVAAPAPVTPAGALGIFNWGWGESAYLQDIQSVSFPQPVFPIECVDRLIPKYFCADPEQVCMMIDNGKGVLTFRVSPTAGPYCWQVGIIYQARAAKMTKPQDVFQWPDNLSFVLTEVALSYAFRFATGMSSKDTASQVMMAQQAITSALGAEDRESTTEGFTPRSLHIG